MVEYQNKFKPLNILIKWFLLSFYSSESFHLSDYMIWGDFWPTYRNFSALQKQVEIVSQIYWIPDLQSLQLVCFMVAKTWERKYVDTCFDRALLKFFV